MPQNKQEMTNEAILKSIPLGLHASFSAVYEKLKKWRNRFSQTVDNKVFNDLFLVYLLANRSFLDHRSSNHLFRLTLSIHAMQKRLLRSATFLPNVRHLKIRWLPTHLRFPFASKPVLGCVIGFNLMNRYELFDEENVLLALQKHLPQLRIVKESSYYHGSQHKTLKLFYLEIEKTNGAAFSLLEQTLLRTSLEEKIKNSIQTLAPTIFMKVNEEEVYKNIFVLSQEIQSVNDLPQAYITFDKQTGSEIVFRVTLVHISPFHHFSLKERFFDCAFTSERVLTVKHIENHPIEAHIFRLSLPREMTLLRSDGSLDFYSARQRVVGLMVSAIGEFRDFNGGILIKQQELLHDFKQSFPEIAQRDNEMLELFFYGIMPLEKQTVLPKQALQLLFNCYLENLSEKLSNGSSYSLKVTKHDEMVIITVHGECPQLKETLNKIIQEEIFISQDLAYNLLERAEGIFFNCILMQSDNTQTEQFIQTIQFALKNWDQKTKQQQTLRLAIGYSVNLDPRIGGDNHSSDFLRILFEGLTCLNQNGQVENALAESIEISSDLKHYTFKLRPAMWNNGSPVTAYDFEYAWKKILSPDFKTSFATIFYPIKNAQEAKEGLVSSDLIGIKVIDDRTLKVELVRPTPYFLELTTLPLYSPIHRLIDQQYPQWPYACEKNYPCNGPFQLKINQPHQGYQLVRNPYYWNAKNVTLDEITFTLMQPQNAFHSFQKKEIDWLGNPFSGWQVHYTPGPDDLVVVYPDSYVCWLVFNTSSLLFNNKKIRQALAYAINRSELISHAFIPLNCAYSPLLPQHGSQGRQTLFPEYNSETAKKLFAEGLQELGLDRKALSSLDFVFHEKGIREFIAQSLKQQLKRELDIELNLTPRPWSHLFNQMTEGNFQMGLMHWVPLVDDPIYTLNSFKSPKENINLAKWENSEFTRSVELAEQATNPFQRSSHLLTAEQILVEQMPVIPLFYQPTQALVRKDLRLVYRKPWGPFQISKSFFKKENPYGNVYARIS